MIELENKESALQPILMEHKLLEGYSRYTGNHDSLRSKKEFEELPKELKDYFIVA